MWKDHQKLKIAKKNKQVYESFMMYKKFVLKLWY